MNDSREDAKNAKVLNVDEISAATFKEGVKRIVNQHSCFASSRLRVNPKIILKPPYLRAILHCHQYLEKCSGMESKIDPREQWI